MPPTCLRRYADQHRPLLHGPLEAAMAQEERLRSDMASVNIATAYILKAPNHVGAPRPSHIRVGYNGDVVAVALVDEEGAATVEEALDGPRSKGVNLFLVCETRRQIAELPGPAPNLAAPRTETLAKVAARNCSNTAKKDDRWSMRLSVT